MKEINNKGFTLVELIATVVLLSLVMGIGAFAITEVIKSAKEKDYQLLIENINNAVELYYQECKFASNEYIDCPDKEGDGYFITTLGDLVDYGFLKANGRIDDDGGDINKVKNIVVNPNDDENISHCSIKYKYFDGKMVVLNNGQNATNSCPASY